MDKEQIKKALDFFEEDNFKDAKDIISKEVKDALNSHLLDKLGIDLNKEKVDTEKVDTENDIKEEGEKDGDEYKAFFKKMLKKFGVNEPDELSGDKKKEFYNAVDKGWKADKETD